jgi:uncharacterized protein
MMRVVIDTNVLVSAVILPLSKPQVVWQYAAQACTVLASTVTFNEFSEVLNRSKFDRYVPSSDRIMFLSLFARLSEKVSITRTITACRDPKDNTFLELAVCGKADVLVFGDEDLRALHPFEGVQILSPAQFLANYDVV